MSATPPGFLGPLLGALVVAILVALAIRRWKLPYTVALVIAGIFVGWLGPRVIEGLDTGGVLTPDIILFLILPPLLFDGASKMDFSSLKRNWRIIGLLALPGVLVNMLVIGGLIWLLIWQAESDKLVYALLIGAILAPTDPVSVLALFKETGAPHRLSLIVEGESLFNDGTGVVLFQVVLAIILSLLAGVEVGIGGALATGIASFVSVVVIGGVVGASLAVAANFALKWTTNHLLEVTVTVALAFGAFLLAENFGGSGVIAVVVAGLIVGNHGKMVEMTPQARVALDNFWEMVAFLVNSVLFLLIGFEIVQRISLTEWTAIWAAFVAIAAALLARLIVYPSCWFQSRNSSSLVIPKEWQHVIFLGGLRGSIPLAMLLILAHMVHEPVKVVEGGQTMSVTFPHEVYEVALVMVFAVVLWTLMVQGPLMKPMMSRFGIGGREDDLSNDFEKRVAQVVASNAALKEIQQFEESGFITKAEAEECREKETVILDESIEELRIIISDTRFKARLKGRLDARLLAIKQRAIGHAEAVGLVHGHIGEELRWKLDTQLADLLESEDLKGEVPLPGAEGDEARAL